MERFPAVFASRSPALERRKNLPLLNFITLHNVKLSQPYPGSKTPKRARVRLLL